MPANTPTINGNRLKPYLLPGTVLSILALVVSVGGGYIGRQRADAGAAATTQEQLLEIRRQLQVNTEKIDKMNERMTRDMVSKELYLQFTESQKEASKGLKEQLTLIGDRIK